MPEKPSNTHKILEEARTVREETQKARAEGLFQELERRVFKPLFDVDYEADVQDISQGGNQMRFTKTEVSKQDKKRLASYIASHGKSEAGEGGFPDENSWQAVDQLTYRIGETDLNIFSHLPEGYKILFCPANKAYHNGAVDYKNKVIYITGDISSLGSIATILHEVGHVNDDERLKKIDETELAKGGDYHENIEAEKMRKEREASLFALRKIWRELRKNEEIKKDMLLYLKNLAYYSYCEKGLVNIATARAMAHHNPYDLEADEAEMRERENFDAWWKFKHSDEYQAWKNIEEFAKLDEDEEYEAWLGWIEKTEKINDADFQEKFFGYKNG
ncbi:MAG TPA: hypothetical protein PLF71_03850 [bacterium]|mgnify:CR=1 FL=1|nr:MAG: hypothetical protein BWY14_00914 [Parcubacteria group bacterium ADurb.Bin192]HPN15217.1 hypothetical protein [bacterium]